MGRSCLACVVAVLVMCVLLQGCAWGVRKPDYDRTPQPRVFSIGHEAVLTFDPGNELSIPVDMAFLGSTPQDSQVTVQLSGTSPPQDNEYALRGASSKTPTQEMMGGHTVKITQSFRASADADIVAAPSLRVWVSGGYTDRLESGDHVCVRLDYSPLGNGEVGLDGGLLPRGADETGSRGSVSRTFTVYKAADFRREMLSTLIPIHQIAAFPLPDSEVEQLFGRQIADRYYVVRLAARNVSDKDWLITTGMTRASGRAIVTPKDDRTRQFSVPVMVSPQEREAVYAVLESDEVQAPRTVVFRALEFTGTLATAVANAFSWGTSVIKGLGIYTGVGIPEGKKLFPDKFGAYKRNLVNFAMPAYVKVPKHSMAPPQFIFFSKDQIQALVLDANLFGEPRGWGILSSSLERREIVPDAFVAYLAFDNMEIPYENVEVPNQATLDALNKRAESRTSDALEKQDSVERAATAAAGAAGAVAPAIAAPFTNAARRGDAAGYLRSIEDAASKARDAFYKAAASPGSSSASEFARDAEAQLKVAELGRDRVLALSALDAADALIGTHASDPAAAALRQRLAKAETDVKGAADAKAAAGVRSDAESILREAKALR